MDGQLSLDDFLKPELENKSGKSRVVLRRVRDRISVEIYYDEYALCCEVDADELKERVNAL